MSHNDAELEERNPADLAFEAALGKAFGAWQANLLEGGPEVDFQILESFVDHALGTSEEAAVLEYIGRYRSWANALLELRAAPPSATGPAVDQALLHSFLTDQLPPSEAVVVRRNIRLYQDWREAAERGLD